MHASHRRISTPVFLLTAGLLATFAGCLANQDRASESGASHPAISDVVLVAPPTSAKEALNLPGVHNIVTYAPDLVCGGVPEGDEGFETLQKMGIKTIISVDGATPDLKRAKAHGLRYVHLPIGYDTVTTERQQQLAQAISNVEGPIFMHCHHGKHRSGAGLGTALVRAGRMSVEEVSERMHVSGTSKSYEGLWQSVREAQPMSKDELQADPASFPSTTQVTGMVATMAEIDQVIAQGVRSVTKKRLQKSGRIPERTAAKGLQNRLACKFKTFTSECRHIAACRETNLAASKQDNSPLSAQESLPALPSHRSAAPLAQCGDHRRHEMRND